MEATVSAPAQDVMRDLWRHPTFVQAAATQQAHNHIRRAQQVLDNCPPLPGEQAKVLAAQRSQLAMTLQGWQIPSIAASIALKIDIDQRHPLSLDLGLALVAMGSVRLARLDGELQNSLLEMRTPDIAVLLQSCARLGWDREIDRTISAIRPCRDSGHLGDALHWRIRREPWRVINHTANWRVQLQQARALAATLETQDDRHGESCIEQPQSHESADDHEYDGPPRQR